MVEIEVQFVHAALECRALLQTDTIVEALHAIAELAYAIAPSHRGARPDGPWLVANCPSCHERGAWFAHSGAQEWPGGDTVPALQLWECPSCHTTLSTNGIVRAHAL